MGDGRGGAVTDTLVRAPALSPLYRMAILKGAEVSVLLHRRGAPLEARGDRGRMPLLLAASAGRLQTFRLVIAEGADLSAAGADGRTAADPSPRSPSVDCVERSMPRPRSSTWEPVGRPRVPLTAKEQVGMTKLSGCNVDGRSPSFSRVSRGRCTQPGAGRH